MKLIVSIVALSVALVFGCKGKEHTNGNTGPSQPVLVQSEITSNTNSDWVNAVNAKTGSAIEKIYAAHAIKVISADSVIHNATQIANFYRSLRHKITSIESLYSVEASKEQGIHYDLLRYTLDDLKEYIQLVIWRVNDARAVREFEFTQLSSSEAIQVDTNAIAERRKLWIQLCNSNDAESLVKQLYSRNTLYYNHKPIVKGSENLIKEYDYMNAADYNLELQPIELKVVNANFAVEIGQCSGSYGGKYILVWENQGDGNWKVYIDSNI